MSLKLMIRNKSFGIKYGGTARVSTLYLPHKKSISF